MSAIESNTSSGTSGFKHTAKATFDKGWKAFERIGAPINKVSNKVGSEAFWPQSMEKECDKAARILKSFCKDGFYKEYPKDAAVSATAVQDGPRGKPKVLVKIPQSVIQNAVGIAIFTTLRTGMWVSGAGGSGILIGRTSDGSWSPPSGILIHTLGVGFLLGVDIYDCVIIINTYEALAKFSKLRVSLGAELSVVAGPLGAGGVLETDFKEKKPILSYMKSRGLYGGVQADGTLLLERNDENARFYGERAPVRDILQGKLRRIPPETKLLLETVRDAEGVTDVNHALLQHIYEQPPPSDIAVGSSHEFPTDKLIIDPESTLTAQPAHIVSQPPEEIHAPPQYMLQNLEQAEGQQGQYCSTQYEEPLLPAEQPGLQNPSSYSAQQRVGAVTPHTT